jgi:hypothetical protein
LRQRRGAEEDQPAEPQEHLLLTRGAELGGHAPKNRADAKRTTASSSTRCRRVSLRPIAPYVNAFTALATTSPITVREISDCRAIASFAQAVMGMTSVGLKAVLVVMPRMR